MNTEEEVEKEVKGEVKNKVGQEQIYDLLLSRELSWQEIIYDLINSEQLDPWDIDLAVLTAKFLEKVREMEEANFFISSKVLLASSILLRIKSEILLNIYIRNIDEILFGKKEQKSRPFEKIEFDEELPDLIPKTPLPRLKKVTLPELMQALERAMVTEHRRIKREVFERQAERRAAIVLPRFSFNIREKIREVYGKIKDFFKHAPAEKLTFSYLAGNGGRGEKIGTFVPLLHLYHQSRINLEQEKHFDEIFIYLKERRENKERKEKIEIDSNKLINEKLNEENENTI